jgi:hypothetical protein
MGRNERVIKDLIASLTCRAIADGTRDDVESYISNPKAIRTVKAALDAIENVTYADVSWAVEDITSLRPDWSDEKAEDFLCANQNRLRDRTIELGWEVIECLLPIEEDDDVTD